jgi:hypothetical protein
MEEDEEWDSWGSDQDSKKPLLTTEDNKYKKSKRNKGAGFIWGSKQDPLITSTAVGADGLGPYIPASDDNVDYQQGGRCTTLWSLIKAWARGVRGCIPLYATEMVPRKTKPS